MADAAWTEEQVTILKGLWAEGRSGGQVAGIMGLSRNSIIGKINRLKLAKRGNQGTHTTRAQRTEARMQREPVKPHGNKGQPKVTAIVARASAMHALPPMRIQLDDETEVGVDVSKRVGLIDLTNDTCRWPVGAGSGASQMFCGCAADMLVTGPYCPAHSKRAAGYGHGPRP